MTATRRDMAAHSPCSNIQSCFVRRSILLLVLLSSITFLAGLGRPAIGDSDEAFYAEAGREMVELGDWLTPHYNYEYRFQKPILFYWLVAGSFATLGVGEAQARLWAGVGGHRPGAGDIRDRAAGRTTNPRACSPAPSSPPPSGISRSAACPCPTCPSPSSSR